MLGFFMSWALWAYPELYIHNKFNFLYLHHMKFQSNRIPLMLTYLLISLFAHGQLASPLSEGDSGIIEFAIKPSVTDSQITAADTQHLVMYHPSMIKGKLFLFLPGTNGIPLKGPRDLFVTAVESGYHVINLSYINQPAVARTCNPKRDTFFEDCAEQFRMKRVFGQVNKVDVPDQPQDAILNRLTKLLVYLSIHDDLGGWNNFLENGTLKWELITVSGQSQGGGMAAFIAKRVLVDKVISFSGGWDFSAKDQIANWYANESITPTNRFYATYNVAEPMAATIAKTCKAMSIPKEQIFALSLEKREGKKAHSDGVRNLLYKDLWIDLLNR